MSLKNSLVKLLSKGPHTSGQLRTATGASRTKVIKTLNALIEDKKVRAEGGMYFLHKKTAKTANTTSQPANGIPCKLVKLGKSFGFAAALDDSGDIFIPGHSLMGAMPGDEIMVSLFTNPRVVGSREGEVTSILACNNKVVGTVSKLGNKLVLVPDNAHDTPLLIRKSADGGARAGEKAAGEILERGLHQNEHVVGITFRFGSADSARQCAKAILYGAGVEKSFPSDVKEEAKSVGVQKISKAELKNREDLREHIIFTIDSASTKDIDDAVSAKKTPEGFELAVHIADVSHYVQPKTPLDNEALNRGCSIYYADSVIPMLPRQLSNGICSLNPKEDRLAFSCIMQLDKNGRMLDYRFVKSVICSSIKGVYSEINTLLDKTATEEIQNKYAEVEPVIRTLAQIYTKLSKLRAQRGCMEIESDEPHLVLNEAGECVGVEKRTRGEAERMIEEFMLMANTAAAHMARRLEIPFVYRVHDAPSADRVDALKNVLTAAGLHVVFKEDTPTQVELAQLLDDTRGTPLERAIHTAVLRSQAKAKYEPLPKGHFGLALVDYAHFTSPIRRYPDLAIHRILSDVVQGTPAADIRKKYTKFAALASTASSEKELVALKVERSCDDCYKAEYMRQFIGEEFEGIVSSVTSFGLYVELPNTVEGMIHVSRLSNNHMELSGGMVLSDPLSGKSYRIGDALGVRVESVDVSQGNVDFSLA